jgi:hypothetical protein
VLLHGDAIDIAINYTLTASAYMIMAWNCLYSCEAYYYAHLFTDVLCTCATTYAYTYYTYCIQAFLLRAVAERWNTQNPDDTVDMINDMEPAAAFIKTRKFHEQ